jgi:stage III sporulation protein AH
MLAEAQDVSDNGELNIEDGVPGEAVLASTAVDSSYFISNKLDREQVRAKNKETLMSIIESPDVADEAKQKAIDDMIKLTEVAEKESATEMLLEAKGFNGAVVFIVDDTCNVVVNASNLTDQQLAIIEDVVKDETEIAVGNIHINTVVVEE